MTCKKCGTSNSENRKYCSKCGNLLCWICQCSFVNDLDSKYCGGCGKSFQTQKLPIPQYSLLQIEDLISGKILFNLGEEDIIKQDDIDKIF